MPTKRPTPLIHLLDDDVSMQYLLTSFLEKSGFRVEAYSQAADFFQAFDKKQPDAVLLDLGLPDEDGLVVARKLRHHSNVPLMIVSARDEDQDRLVGLEIGADDYLTKPFKPRELVIRLENLLKRAQVSQPGRPVLPGEATGAVRFGDFSMDLAKRRLVSAKSGTISLTRGEFDCLATLVKAGGDVVGRDRLKDAISHRGEPPGDRTVDSIICRIRRKTGTGRKGNGVVLTVSGYGYQLNPDLELLS
ncbi:MAG: response regulator transcription factor [Magnetococcales bacterium]|nr:response regulator transcription factor [Magnetococcales bacterium]